MNNYAKMLKENGESDEIEEISFITLKVLKK